MKKYIVILAFFITGILQCGLLYAQSNLNNSAFFNGYLNNGSRIRTWDNYPVNPGTANQGAYQISGKNITLEAWVYPVGFPKSPPTDPIIQRPYYNGQDPFFSYSLFVKNMGGYPQACFGISNGTPGSMVEAVDPDTLPLFKWTHITGTYDGSNLRIYVNGVLKGQFATNISISASGFGLVIGRFGTNRFQGLIDEVRIWNIARNKSDITGDMNTELSGSEAGLAGYWKMNAINTENNAPVILDQTSNHNDLVVDGQTPIVPFSPTTSIGSPSYTFSPSSINYGIVEQGSIAQSSLSFTNSSNYPLFGSLNTPNSNVQINQGAIYVPPNSTQNIPTSIIPQIGNNISDNLNLLTNAGDTTSVPFTVSPISLRRFNANNISMWLQRDGRFARNPLTGNAGLEWKAGSGNTAVFASGIWIGAKVSGSVRTAAAVYGTEFSPGPVVNGTFADPNSQNYRVFKINKGDTTSTDYQQWPVSLGAPVNSDGSPKVIGDQTLFAVYNDLDQTRHFFGTTPLGAEVQQTTFGFNTPGPLSNTVFLRFKITNESSSTWDSTYVSLWSDPDLGYPYDDLVGIDTARNMGFVYNGSDNDGVYGSAPPALGYKILKGAYFSKPIQAFAYYTNGATYPNTDPGNAQQAYDFMQGKRADGSSYINTKTSQPTVFALNGDPVAGTGWTDSNPGDRRFLFSTGPLSLDPGQSKEMIAAIIVGRGNSNLNSISVLRSEADSIQSLYDGGYIFGGALENVTTSTTSANSSGSLNDFTNSSTTINYNTGSSGATVEVASYAGPPPGSQDITTSTIAGVGKYMDVQTSGTITWPVTIRVYYTANDLRQAGVLESDLKGLYYWDATNSRWNLYSNSGPDDQGRGTSTTYVDTTNVTINGTRYEGFVAAVAYHLTPITIGAAKKTITDRYQDLITFVGSLPISDFKRPGKERQKELIESIKRSKEKFDKGKKKEAYHILSEFILNHLVNTGDTHRKDEKHHHKNRKNHRFDHDESNHQLWVTDQSARDQIKSDINDLLTVLSKKTKQVEEKSFSPGIMQHMQVPGEYSLSQNYPNPFNPTTTIKYGIAHQGFVSLKVYNLLGQVVATLVNREMPAGQYTVNWNASRLSSGVYLYRLKAGSFTMTKKLVLMK